MDTIGYLYFKPNDIIKHPIIRHNNINVVYYKNKYIILNNLPDNVKIEPKITIIMTKANNNNELLTEMNKSNSPEFIIINDIIIKNNIIHFRDLL